MSAIERRAALPDPGDLVDHEEEIRLGFLLDSLYRQMLAEVHAVVAAALDLDPATFRVDDADTRALLDQAATRVVGISETTRHGIADILKRGQAAGTPTPDIADQIERLFTQTWAGRAETIARTEIAEAQRLSSLDRYEKSGVVDRVFIIDGEDDSPCKERNGTTVPLSEAPTLGHPRCTMVLVPVLIGQDAP